MFGFSPMTVIIPFTSQKDEDQCMKTIIWTFDDVVLPGLGAV
jgi:hypothetical protein